jgi:Ser/Thr protein kinase RdoA (MazF antagonist)
LTWAQTLADLPPDAAARAASLWNDKVLERVGLSANLVYRLESGRYLRLVHSSLRDAPLVAAGVDWARWLEANGVSVSVALESSGGCLIERIGDWLATVWRGVGGKPLSDAITDSQLEAWGAAAGLMHKASVGFEPRAVLTSSGAVLPQRFSLRVFWRNIEPVVRKDAELLEVYRRLTSWLEGLPETEQLTCHGDFRPANAIWDGEKVWIIDFDEPVLAWPEYDLARAMSRDKDGPFANLSTNLEVFKRGYERHQTLNLERLQTFIQLHALLSLSWSLGDASWGWSHDLRRLALEGIRF